MYGVAEKPVFPFASQHVFFLRKLENFRMTFVPRQKTTISGVFYRDSRSLAWNISSAQLSFSMNIPSSGDN